MDNHWQEVLAQQEVDGIIGNDCGGNAGAEALIMQGPDGTFTVETIYTDDQLSTTNPAIVDHVLEEFDIPKTGWQ